jgi:hypothetical protein
MLHIGNIPHVLSNGITHAYSPNRNPNFIPIGDTSLISTRSTLEVTVDNGETLSYGYFNKIVLGQFIPFYFGIKMPMLYVMQHGGNFVPSPTPREKIVYVACKLETLIAHYPGFYFCDGHATDRLTSFYDQTKIENLPELIEWKAVQASYWGGSENLNLKRKKQAEFLQAADVKPEHIAKFGCYNENAKSELTSMGIKEELIQVVPKAYF